MRISWLWRMHLMRSRRKYRCCSSRFAILSVLMLILSCAWFVFIFSIGRCCPPPPPAAIKSDPISIPYRNPRINTVAKNGTVTSKLSLDNIVFGIAGSSELWSRRKEFIRLWWRPDKMRGFVWLERPVEDSDSGLPPVKVSETTNGLRDAVRGNQLGHPTGVRIARIVLETFKMRLPNVKWFILCDDDTLFSVENLINVLAKYDPSELYYIGSTSESHQQNVAFSYDMAFGGAGFALSYPLAEALVRMEDECLQHYPQLMGSDDRLRACISELGVPLTKEAGFHQCDVRGNAMGLLAAHPVAPFVSLHHLEVMDPLFPNLDTLQGLQVLSKAMVVESSSFLQQAICYDRDRGVTFSVSSGYVVQVYPDLLYPKVLEKAELTFSAWNHKKRPRDFDLDARVPFWICRQPFLFFLEDMGESEDGLSVISLYRRFTSLDRRKMMCWHRAEVPERIRVVSRPLSIDWYKAPRRQCCQVGKWKDGGMVEVEMGSCKPGESIVQIA